MFSIRSMRLAEGVEWTLHCCTVLGLLPRGTAMPAARLAEFHGVPGAYLAKHLQALSRAGIVESVAGPRGGYRLARPPADITLLEIVLAVEGDEPAFRCAEIRRRGPSAIPANGYPKPCGIARAMWQAEDAWRRELQAQTVADMIAEMAANVDPRAARKGAAWLQEVLTR
jgi:Rrf2 family protein